MNLYPLLTLAQKIGCAYTAMCQPILEKFHLSQPSFDILLFLANNPECCTAKEISILRHIKPNVISVHVDKLVNIGYLEQHTMMDDRRKKRLRYTEKALPIIEEGRRVQKDFCAALTKGLSQEDVDALLRTLHLFRENADALRQG